MKTVALISFLVFTVTGWCLAAERLGKIDELKQHALNEYSRGVKDMAFICGKDTP